MSKYSNIKNLEQLDREIKLLKRQSVNASKSLRREITNALWYYSPARVVSDAFDSVKAFFKRFF